MSKAKRVKENPDHWSQITGDPDKEDKKNIARLINNFKKEMFEHEGEQFTGEEWIKREVDAAKDQHQAYGVEGVANQLGEKIKTSEFRIGTAVPNVLWGRIQESYPTLFRDKKHFAWFMKNFPEFTVAERI